MDIAELKSRIAEHWVSSLVTGIVGLFLGFSATLFNAEISENRYFLEKQVVAADRVALEFSKYVENWRRLIEFKKNVNSQNRKPSDAEINQLKNYASARDKAKDALFSALDALHLYFGEDAINISKNFRAWDEQQSIKLINHLPEISEWQSKGYEIFLAMRKEILDE